MFNPFLCNILKPSPIYLPFLLAYLLVWPFAHVDFFQVQSEHHFLHYFEFLGGVCIVKRLVIDHALLLDQICLLNNVNEILCLRKYGRCGSSEAQF